MENDVPPLNSNLPVEGKKGFLSFYWGCFGNPDLRAKSAMAGETLKNLKQRKHLMGLK